jgi:hypothetical protein
MYILPHFGVGNSCPKYVRTVQLHFVYDRIILPTTNNPKRLVWWILSTWFLHSVLNGFTANFLAYGLGKRGFSFFLTFPSFTYPSSALFKHSIIQCDLEAFSWTKLPSRPDLCSKPTPPPQCVYITSCHFNPRERVRKQDCLSLMQVINYTTETQCATSVLKWRK